MRSKAILMESTFFSILCVLAFSIILSKDVKAQKKNNIINEQLLTKQTQENITNTLLGDDGEALCDGKQRFLVTADRSVIGVMRGSSDKEKKAYWYISVSGLTGGVTETVEKQLTKKDGEYDEYPGESELDNALPTKFGLSQNYPNPFNPSTTIEFQIPLLTGSQQISTSLKIYDIRGRLIKTILNKKLPPGYYSEFWNGLNDKGERVSSGIYFYGLKADNFTSNRKMIIIK